MEYFIMEAHVFQDRLAMFRAIRKTISLWDVDVATRYSVSIETARDWISGEGEVSIPKHVISDMKKLYKLYQDAVSNLFDRMIASDSVDLDMNSYLIKKMTKHLPGHSARSAFLAAREQYGRSMDQKKKMMERRQKAKKASMEEGVVINSIDPRAFLEAMG